MQNELVEYLQQLLSSGTRVTPEERRAMYKFFLETRVSQYQLDASELIKNKYLQTSFANAEIRYQISGNSVSFDARKKGEIDFTKEVRSMRLRKLKFMKRRNIEKFFAQTEVDVACNYPINTSIEYQPKSVNIFSFAFYDLKYYSKGRSEILGLVNKLKTRDSETLRKLRAS